MGVESRVESMSLIKLMTMYPSLELPENSKNRNNIIYRYGQRKLVGASREDAGGIGGDLFDPVVPFKPL